MCRSAVQPGRLGQAVGRADASRGSFGQDTMFMVEWRMKKRLGIDAERLMVGDQGESEGSARATIG